MVSAEERHFRVIVRVRPLLQHEVRAHKEALHVHEQEVVLQTQDAFAQSTTHTFQFDDAFDARHSQAAVFDRAARPAVESMLQGFNASIIAYGQTGAGKTFTMEGSSTEGHGAGIIPRSVRHIFDHIEQGRFASPTRFLVRAAYLQIYNESVSDLLKPELCNLTIRETKRRGLYVDQLSEWVVRSPAELAGLLSRGAAARTTAATKANEASSRSHAVFILIVEQSQALPTLVEEGPAANGARRFCVAKLNLVDLAGSERARTSGASGVRLQECKSINTSLSALGNVIFALTDTKGRPHVPYRDSKLTRLLQDSLGGNCKTTMIACASPTDAAAAESLSTLKFAHRAQHVRNHAHVNADVDQKLILHRYETELASLRTQLLERTRGVVDKRRLLEVEEQRRQAEEDKLEAIRELENRSQEVLQEKAAKRRLEAQISQMEGQLLMSGGAVAPSSGLSNEKVQWEYQVRLAELEREREAIERDKEQVHRYKLLLQKQREILIALTSRLNERDETILLLQQELDIRSVRIYELEDSLDRKTAQLIHLQRVSLEHGRLGVTSISGERPERSEIEDWDQQQMLCRSSGASGSLEAMSITSGSGESYSLLILYHAVTGQILRIMCITLRYCNLSDVSINLARPPNFRPKWCALATHGVLTTAKWIRLAVYIG
ncbi:hypothetical protein AB1Y20_009064 [Prymnesium parvum]|uniref:Kinesin-like protein n=1 Tax=Prymnesium parvum TaxID=97485 RepID=A0AB34K3B2_PRYPA